MSTQRKARPRAVSPPNPTAQLCLTYFFLSSGLAVVASEVTGSSLHYQALLLSGLAALWCGKQTKRSTNRPAMMAPALRNALVMVGIAAGLSATAAVFDSFLDDAAIRSCVFKTLGMIATLTLIARCILDYSRKEIETAILHYAVAELALMLVAVVLGIDVNPNSIAVRCATSGLLLMAGLSTVPKRIGGVVAALSIPFIVKSRTSIIASLGAIGVGWLESRHRQSRGSIIFVAILAGTTFFVFKDDLSYALRSTANAYLGSQNPIAHFFLHDKDQARVADDYLDRKYVWMSALRRIEDRPFIGYGVGTESSLFRGRAHNAFLSLMIEGGIVLLIAWVCVYGLFVHALFDEDWIRHFADTPIGRTQTMLFAYMASSAIVESSGIGSISTPNNVIFLTLLTWVTKELARIKSQRSVRRVAPQPVDSPDARSPVPHH